MNLNLVNLLITLKNASLSQKELVYVKYNKMCEKLLKVLYIEGLINSYTVEVKENENKRVLKICLKSVFNRSSLRNLKIISTPSKIRYLSFSDLSKLSDKRLIPILSTDMGFLTSFQCKNLQIGGKLLFIC
jgi:ribosomal protein S8